MRYLILLFVFATLIFQKSSAQENLPELHRPLNIPPVLSGNFGELRSNAFHAGVDIRTQGVEGKEVFAVADGYVSRIGISPYGYGKVIYITHNDGFTSVYAHLSKFNKTITDYVRGKQYDDKSFSQNIILDKNKFPIKKGDYLGLTGNSGSSGGPHLHYEVLYKDKHINPANYFDLTITPEEYAAMVHNTAEASDKITLHPSHRKKVKRH